MTKKIKLAHLVKVSVFIHSDEDESAIDKALLSLFSFDIAEKTDKKRISFDKKSIIGFNDRKIISLTIILEKQAEINEFLKNIASNLSKEQKTLIMNNFAKLDDMFLFIRLDKKALQNNEFKLAVKDCFHIKISLAVFPKKKSIALQVAGQIFN